MLIIKPMLLPAAILAIAVSAWHCVSTLALDEYGPTTTVHSSTKTVKDENDGGSTTGREDTDFWTRFLVDSQGSLLMTPPILTSAPTGSPTDIVSATPSTMLPTPYPSTQPTSMPSQTPTTRFPSVTPTSPPTVVPTTSSPTDIVSMTPTNGPTSSPSSFPTQAPSTMPTTTPSAQPTNLEVVVADFSQANATDPITLYSLPDEEGATNVEVMLPNNQSDVYVITDSSNQGSAGTATCPPTGGIQVPSTGTTVTIPLNGIDTEIVICSGSVIIGRCYHRFQSRVSPTGQVRVFCFFIYLPASFIIGKLFSWYLWYFLLPSSFFIAINKKLFCILHVCEKKTHSQFRTMKNLILPLPRYHLSSMILPLDQA